MKIALTNHLKLVGTVSIQYVMLTLKEDTEQAPLKKRSALKIIIFVEKADDKLSARATILRIMITGFLPTLSAKIPERRFPANRPSM